MFDENKFNRQFKLFGTVFIVFFVGILMLIVGSVIFTLSGGQVPCSMYANTPAYETPARCLKPGTIPVPVYVPIEGR